MSVLHRTQFLIRLYDLLLQALLVGDQLLHDSRVTGSNHGEADRLQGKPGHR